MAANSKDYFDNEVPGMLAAHPDKAKSIGATYLFKIAGDGGGEWTVDCAAAEPYCKPGVQAPAKCEIECANEIFMKILENPAVSMQLFLQGKLKIKGDPMLATKLQKLLTMGK